MQIYKISKLLPKDEKYGITSQLKRATLSIELNIVEGNARISQRDFARFLSNSLGSCSEVKCIIDVINDLEYISKNYTKKIQNELNVVEKMITSLRNSLFKYN